MLPCHQMSCFHSLRTVFRTRYRSSFAHTRYNSTKMPHSVHTPSGSSTPLSSQQASLPLGQRYWNANVPETSWTDACPDFLVGQGEKNIGILFSKQDDYRNLSWPESKKLVGKENFSRYTNTTSNRIPRKKSYRSLSALPSRASALSAVHV